MKNILMITPFFAPYSHAAVYRAHRFAKYLPRFGWKPHILTVDKSFLYFIDNALLDDLPEDVEIIPARHIHLIYAEFKSLFAKFKAPTPSDLTAKLQKRQKKNLIKSIINKFSCEVVFLPDRYITWYPFALKKAKEIINSKHISAIYSTTPPLTPNLIAMNLKRRFKIPWIADFRDPGVEMKSREFSSAGINYKINCMIEKKTMKEADLILTTSESARDLFLSKYKGIADDKIICIRHGTDFEIGEGLKLREKNKKFTIIFVGEFLPAYGIIFFKLLKVIFERKLFERKNVEVLIVGSIKRNIHLEREIELLGLSDVVRLIDYLSLKDYFSILLSADATLLPGSFKNVIQIKLSDYLFVKKPIITFNANDEIQSILEKSGLGVFIPNQIEDGIMILLNLLRENYKLNINEDYINQFSASNRTREFSDVLIKLIEKTDR